MKQIVKIPLTFGFPCLHSIIHIDTLYTGNQGKVSDDMHDESS